MYDIGSFVDVIDLEAIWREAKIYDMYHDKYVIHFLGWNYKWNEYINIGSDRIQPPYSKVKNWRNELKVNDTIEFLNNYNKWESGKIIEINQKDNLVVVTNINNNITSFNICSEKIAYKNTHFSLTLDSKLKILKIKELPIHSAIIHNQINKLNNILSNSDNITEILSTLGNSGKTPLLLAVSFNNHFIIKELLKYKKDLILDVDKFLDTCLHVAIKCNVNLECITELLEAGANVNAQNMRLATPLHLVAMRGDVKTGKELIKYGAKINMKDIEGNTPLHHASYRGELDFIKLLLDNNVNPFILNNNKVQPIEISSLYRNSDNRNTICRLLNNREYMFIIHKLRFEKTTKLNDVYTLIPKMNKDLVNKIIIYFV